jgi:hypothetical protein
VLIGIVLGAVGMALLMLAASEWGR